MTAQGLPNRQGTEEQGTPHKERRVRRQGNPQFWQIVKKYLPGLPYSWNAPTEADRARYRGSRDESGTFRLGHSVEQRRCTYADRPRYRHLPEVAAAVPYEDAVGCMEQWRDEEEASLREESVEDTREVEGALVVGERKKREPSGGRRREGGEKECVWRAAVFVLLRAFFF